MTTTETPLTQQQLRDESEVGRMEQILSGRAPALEQVSAFAGDRPLTDAEQVYFAELRQQRGEQFFPDLLYAVTHQVFAPENAEAVWQAILQHKYLLSEALKRNIRITVAALDYLANLTGTLPTATVIAEEHITRMVRLTQHDGLTHLFNHASFFQKLEFEMHCFARCEHLVAVMMLDVDNFKAINDSFGHSTGDNVLIDLATLLTEVVRKGDICCRYGGEEFAVILPATGAQDAGLLAARFQELLALARPGGQQITVSIGVAVCGAAAHNAHALVEKADAALYAAKHRGKNCVVVDAD